MDKAEKLLNCSEWCNEKSEHLDAEQKSLTKLLAKRQGLKGPEESIAAERELAGGKPAHQILGDIRNELRKRLSEIAPGLVAEVPLVYKADRYISGKLTHKRSTLGDWAGIMAGFAGKLKRVADLDTC